MPSIHPNTTAMSSIEIMCFKPYYNWNAFNTMKKMLILLNHQLGFKPYYNWNAFNTLRYTNENRNLLLPSFKPYYNWNAFNT